MMNRGVTYLSKTLILLLLCGLLTGPKYQVVSSQEREGEKQPFFTVDDSIDREESQPKQVLVIHEEMELEKILKAFPEASIEEVFENSKSIAIALEKEEILEILKKEKLLSYVEDVFEDEVGTIFRIPEDPYYRSHQWYLTSIGMEYAWDIVPTKEDVLVAVIDTGVTPYNDLRNVIPGADFSQGVLLEDTYPGEHSYDGGFHGTAVAATIAAQHNRIAIAGVHPKTKIMGVKVFPDGSEKASMNAVASAIRWSVDQGADIINLSLGSSGGTSLLKSAVAYAKEKDVLLVSASGNDGYTDFITYPAAYEESMAVGSSDPYGGVSWFSNKGYGLDLVAPGQEIILPQISYGEGYYSIMNGTSFATPMVAGVAAMIMDVYPNISAERVRSILNSTAKDIGLLGWDKSSGHGILDAKEAMIRAKDYASSTGQSSELVGIELHRLPKKRTYGLKEPLVLEGLEVLGIYGNGEKLPVPMESLTISGFQSAHPQQGQVITVAYGDHQATFTVDIVEKVLQGLTILTPPTKTTYRSGEALELTGLLVEGTYVDGEKEIQQITLENIRGFQNERAVEKQTITIFKGEVETSFDIKILKNPSLTSIYGTNRFTTAIALSQSHYEKADTVILVNGLNFPDGLSAGPLAAALNAPILLSRKERLSEENKREMERLGAKNVLLLGGESVIDAAVEKELAKSYTVTRIAGTNRYLTSVYAAEYLAKKTGVMDTVILASGLSYPDALSIGSYASQEGYPILLTNMEGLQEKTKEFLQQQPIKKVILVGGESVMPKSIEEELKKTHEVERIAGNNRYETSLAIAKRFYKDPLYLVASHGGDYADALAAAPFAASYEAPILLVDQAKEREDILAYLRSSSVEKLVVVGGDKAVSESVRQGLLEALMPKE